MKKFVTTSRTHTALGLMAVALMMAMPSLGQTPTITEYSNTGILSGTVSTNAPYKIQWAPSVADPQQWQSQSPFAIAMPTNSTIACAVPAFYRIVAYTNMAVAASLRVDPKTNCYLAYGPGGSITGSVNRSSVLPQGKYVAAITGGPGIAYGTGFTPNYGIGMIRLGRADDTWIQSLNGIWSPTNDAGAYEFEADSGGIEVGVFTLDLGNFGDNSGYVDVTIYRLQ